MGSAREYSTNELMIWSRLFDSVSHFKRAKFYFIDGNYESNNDVFSAKLGFSGLAMTSTGGLASLSGKISTIWKRPDGKNWQIVKWKTKNLESKLTSGLFFEDVTSTVINDAAVVNDLSVCVHDEVTKQLSKGQPVQVASNCRFHFPETTSEHSSINVVDFDNDGLDDFYLTRRYRPNMLFRNLGNGSFEEVAKKKVTSRFMGGPEAMATWKRNSSRSLGL